MARYLTVFGKPRYLGFTEISDEQINNLKCNNIILKTCRGLEHGILNGQVSENYKISGNIIDSPEAQFIENVEFLREINSGDVIEFEHVKHEEDDALIRSREILSEHGLNLKLVDVEYMLDRKKLYFYFTSDQRIDFRSYVKDLAHEFKTRIEMRQIGARDESRIVRGIASCGRPCCCSYWLREFTPIGIQMVKEQRIAINPTKISGLCGRLMCCMSYEQNLYSELWQKLPGPGAKIKTDDGIYTLESLDVSHEIVNIRCPSGHLIGVKIDDFEKFSETVKAGKEWNTEENNARKKFIKVPEIVRENIKQLPSQQNNNNNNDDNKNKNLHTNSNPKNKTSRKIKQ